MTGLARMLLSVVARLLPVAAKRRYLRGRGGRDPCPFVGHLCARDPADGRLPAVRGLAGGARRST
jgi:hypothetical protein